jgi:excisionase family DNA binding protein
MSADVRELNLLTVREVAALLRISERSVRRKISLGLIPAVRLGGGAESLRVDRDELQAWLYAEPGQIA